VGELRDHGDDEEGHRNRGGSLALNAV
jgi:hypothetical protein